MSKRQSRSNEFGQPVGFAVPEFVPPVDIEKLKQTMTGSHCSLKLLQETDIGQLFELFSREPDNQMWTYLRQGPFDSLASFREFFLSCLALPDVYYVVQGKDKNLPLGIAAFLRIDPGSGSIEIGNLVFSHHLRRTVASTEALFLMMEKVFELGFRRCEWKCDSQNAPSVRAAKRLGFKFEGTFRQHMVYKGRNRDTSWLSVVDWEWPGSKVEFEEWFNPGNFDESGKQRLSLGSFRASVE